MIILDTHAWLYWVDDNLKEFSKVALAEIKKASTLGISVISCWEIAMLVVKQRLSLSMDVMDWISQALRYPGTRLLDLEPEIAVMSTRLPGKFPGDPADQIIVATCLKHGAPLVTKDGKIHSWGKIRTIW